MQGLPKDELYPLKFEALPRGRIWGGQKLARLVGEKAQDGLPVGEAWLVWERLAVANGPWRGKPLADLVREHPLQVLGSRPMEQSDAIFPLLLKLVDAGETLSVQVHPDDGYARAREHQPFGKTEFWYVLEADPGAEVMHGLMRPVTPEELKESIAAVRLEEVLEYVPVQRGDVLLLPAGTIHALGGGILVYELQQSSDITYRLYDWGRVQANGLPRELHVEKALEVADLRPSGLQKIQPVEIAEGGLTRRFLCATRYFASELLELRSPSVERPGGLQFHLLTVLEGSCAVEYGEGESLALSHWESALVPAGLPEYRVVPEGQGCSLVKSYVPDLLRDVVKPLEERGVPRESIRQLGGDPNVSDLAGFLR